MLNLAILWLLVFLCLLLHLDNKFLLQLLLMFLFSLLSICFLLKFDFLYFFVNIFLNFYYLKHQFEFFFLTIYSSHHLHSLSSLWNSFLSLPSLRSICNLLDSYIFFFFVISHHSFNYHLRRIFYLSLPSFPSFLS